MVLLTLDASSSTASVCVTRDDALLYESYLHNGRMHAAVLLPMVEDALRCAGLGLEDVDGFACVVGPGSFTGVRIGVCMVKGFAHAVGKPCCAINALEALAMNAAGFDGLVCPILDARRGQVYCAAFDVSSGRPVRALEDAALPLEVFLQKLPEGKRLAFVGDGVPVHGEAIQSAMGDCALLFPPNLYDLRADAACVLASERVDSWVDGARLSPYYLRAPQAERERAERLRGEARS